MMARHRRAVWLGLAVIALTGAVVALRPRADVRGIEWKEDGAGRPVCGSGVLGGEPLREALRGVLLRRATGLMSREDAATFAEHFSGYLAAQFSGGFDCVIGAHRSAGLDFDPSVEGQLRELIRARPARFNPPGWERWSVEEMHRRLYGGGVGWAELDVAAVRLSYVGAGEDALSTLRAGERPGRWIRGPLMAPTGYEGIVRFGPPTWSLAVRGALRTGERVRVEFIVTRYDVGKWHLHRVWVHEPREITARVNTF